MAAPVFRLFLADGSDIGNFATTEWNWTVGDEFWDGQHRRWRIVSIAPAEGEQFGALFVVEPVTR